MGILDGAFLRPQAEIITKVENTSDLSSRNIVTVDNSWSPEYPTVSASPLQYHNSGVRQIFHYNKTKNEIKFHSELELISFPLSVSFIISFIQIQLELRKDSELHLSKYVVESRAGQCGSTLTDLKVKNNFHQFLYSSMS